MLPPGMESEPTPPRTGKKRGRPKKIPIEGEMPPLEQEINTSSQKSTIVSKGAYIGLLTILCLG